jgi:hypothetical protein
VSGTQGTWTLSHLDGVSGTQGGIFEIDKGGWMSAYDLNKDETGNYQNSQRGESWYRNDDHKKSLVSPHPLFLKLFYVFVVLWFSFYKE